MFVLKKSFRILVSFICLFTFYFSVSVFSVTEEKNKSNNNIKEEIKNETEEKLRDETKNDIKKVVYLTFDDGPRKKICKDILEVLDKYDVKATFFVVGKEISGREDILKRMYDEGHAIGLHTYSHDAKSIYRSNENFVNEMIKVQEKVRLVTGDSPNIIRFPWGSTNQYRKLNTKMLDLLHENNLKVYDWNSDTKDGMQPDLSPDRIASNAKRFKKDYPGGIIILMHCNANNENTVKALPKIIEHYKDLGYDFETITDETPEYYHIYKNHN